MSLILLEHLCGSSVIESGFTRIIPIYIACWAVGILAFLDDKMFVLATFWLSASRQFVLQDTILSCFEESQRKDYLFSPFVH